MQRVLFCSSRHVPGTHPPGGPQTAAGAHRLHHLVRGVHADLHHQGEAPDPGGGGHRWGQGWGGWGAEGSAGPPGGGDGAGGELHPHSVARARLSIRPLNGVLRQQALWAARAKHFVCFWIYVILRWIECVNSIFVLFGYGGCLPSPCSRLVNRIVFPYGGYPDSQIKALFLQSAPDFCEQEASTPTCSLTTFI